MLALGLLIAGRLSISYHAGMRRHVVELPLEDAPAADGFLPLTLPGRTAHAQEWVHVLPGKEGEKNSRDTAEPRMTQGLVLGTERAAAAASSSKPSAAVM